MKTASQIPEISGNQIVSSGRTRLQLRIFQFSSDPPVTVYYLISDLDRLYAADLSLSPLRIRIVMAPGSGQT